MDYSDYRIGKVMRAFRLAQGHTLAEGSAKIGISSSTYNRIENGNSTFTLKDMLIFCDAYNMTPKVFLNALDNFQPKVTR